MAEAGPRSSLVVGAGRARRPRARRGRRRAAATCSTARSSSATSTPVLPRTSGCTTMPAAQWGGEKLSLRYTYAKPTGPAVVGGEDSGRHRLERLVEVAPDGFAQGWMAVDRLDVVVQPRHRHEICRRDRLQQDASRSSPAEGTCGPRYRSADGAAARGEAARGGGRAASRRRVPRHRERAVCAPVRQPVPAPRRRRSSRRSRPTRPSTRSRRRSSSAIRRRPTSRTPTPTRSRSSSTPRVSSGRRRRA